MGERTVYFGADPVAAYRIRRDGAAPDDLPARVQVAAHRTALPQRAAVALVVDEDILQQTPRGGIWLLERGQISDASTGRVFQPWHVDVEPDAAQRWKAYLDEERGLTLVNLVGATTPGQLERRETPLVEARAAQLAEQPVRATFDLAHLQAIHRQLFQDVYPWAGETRTVDISKYGGGPSFMPWDHIDDSGQILAGFVQRNGGLKGLDRAEFVEGAAEVYNAVNILHAFREGNGRTQREWLGALACQAGYELDWTGVRGRTNDVASQAARLEDMAPLRAMFDQITRARTDEAERPGSIGSRVAGQLDAAAEHLRRGRAALSGAAAADRYERDDRGPSRPERGVDR